LADFCQTYVTPGATAIANIGWMYYLVFMCLTVVTIVVIYFYYPETKKRTLEELAGFFGETVVTETDLAPSPEKLGSGAEAVSAGKNGESVDYAEKMS
jgi:hypothetical protein